MTPLRVRLMRCLIGALEWLLRLVWLNRRLPEVEAVHPDIAYGSDPKNRLDVVQPPARAGFMDPAPLLIYVHGGAWVCGDKANFAWVTRRFAEGGLLTFSLNYRWSPEASFRHQLEDVSQAIGWAIQAAPSYGGRPDAVFLAGDSAGAHLVSWLHMAQCQQALLDALKIAPPLEPRALRGSLLFYGIYDLELTWALGAAARTPLRCLLSGEPSAAPEQVALLSPLRHVAAGAAPVFVCAGEKDALYGQSVSLLASLQSHGVKHRCALLNARDYPDGGHSFINFGGRRATQHAVCEALVFVEEMLSSDVTRS